MKKSYLFLFLTPLFLISCGENGSNANSKTTKDTSLDDVVVPESSPFENSEYDYYGFDDDDNIYQLSLKCQNSASVAYSSLSAEYQENGIVFYLKFKDNDIYSHNIYDIGLDDNVEIIFNESTATQSWVVGGSYHFLINAEGEYRLQVATSKSGFGSSLDSALGVVPGENFVIDFHKCYEEEDDFNGFAARVFFSYGLLNTTFGDAFGGYSVCLGMRNTHCFGIDSVWKSYTDNGCKWGNASTFINFDEDNTFVK